MSGRREYRKRQWKRRQSEKLTMLLKGSIAVAVVLVLVLTGVKIVSTVQNHKQQKQAEEALFAEAESSGRIAGGGRTDTDTDPGAKGKSSSTYV